MAPSDDAPPGPIADRRKRQGGRDDEHHQDRRARGPDASLIGIFRGVAPFVLTDLVRLALLVAFPWLVLFLPTTMD